MDKDKFYLLINKFLENLFLEISEFSRIPKNTEIPHWFDRIEEFSQICTN